MRCSWVGERLIRGWASGHGACLLSVVARNPAEARANHMYLRSGVGGGVWGCARGIAALHVPATDHHRCPATQKVKANCKSGRLASRLWCWCALNTADPVHIPRLFILRRPLCPGCEVSTNWRRSRRLPSTSSHFVQPRWAFSSSAMSSLDSAPVT